MVQNLVPQLKDPLGVAHVPLTSISVPLAYAAQASGSMLPSQVHTGPRPLSHNYTCGEHRPFFCPPPHSLS